MPLYNFCLDYLQLIRRDFPKNAFVDHSTDRQNSPENGSLCSSPYIPIYGDVWTGTQARKMAELSQSGFDLQWYLFLPKICLLFPIRRNSFF